MSCIEGKEDGKDIHWSTQNAALFVFILQNIIAIATLDFFNISPHIVIALSNFAIAKVVAHKLFAYLFWYWHCTLINGYFLYCSFNFFALPTIVIARKNGKSITIALDVRRAITLWGAIKKTLILRKSTKNYFVIQ